MGRDRRQEPGRRARPAVVPDPPDYTKCVAAKKKPPAPKGQGKQTDAALKKQCKTEYDDAQARGHAVPDPVRVGQQEADKRDITVSDKDVQKSFEDQKKQAFPTDKAYQQFLKTSGMTEAGHPLPRQALAAPGEAHAEGHRGRQEGLRRRTSRSYYNKNKKRFAQPERRDLLVVLTKTEAKAEQAREALESGQPWKTVVKQYSIDEASKAQGGKLAAVAKGQQDKALEDAVFAASKGELQGPVKTQFGWYVFEVEKITPASQQSLDQARDTIKNLLRSQRQQKALDAFIKDFREEYKDKTNCADDYRVAECKNAPKDDDRTRAPASRTSRTSRAAGAEPTSHGSHARRT